MANRFKILNLNPSILGRNPYKHLVITIRARVQSCCTEAQLEIFTRYKSKNSICTFTVKAARHYTAVSVLIRLPLIANLPKLIFYFDLILWTNSLSEPYIGPYQAIFVISEHWNVLFQMKKRPNDLFSNLILEHCGIW